MDDKMQVRIVKAKNRIGAMSSYYTLVRKVYMFYGFNLNLAGVSVNFQCKVMFKKWDKKKIE